MSEPMPWPTEAWSKCLKISLELRMRPRGYFTLRCSAFQCDAHPYGPALAGVDAARNSDLHGGTICEPALRKFAHR